jgi:hypothetical protein
MLTLVGWGLAAMALVAVAGCSSSQATHRQADLTYQRLTAPAADPPMAAGQALPVAREPATVRAPALFFAPRSEPAPLDAPLAEVAAATGAGGSAEPAASARPAAEEKAVKAGEFSAFPEGSFWEVVKSDLRDAPGQLWNGTKLSFGNPTNLAILGVAFGADRVVRHNLDERIREQRERHHFPALQTGDFGTVIGNPGLHFGGALAWYAISVNNRDAKDYALAKALIEALAINDITTGFLQVSAHERAPNGQYFGWPSGHTSSSFAVASVLHQYYGWQVGVPLYMLSGYVAASRIEDREHNVSDLVFGAALGLVIGHSVVKGELPQIGGFTVLPYGGSGAGGLMLMKQW